MKTRRTFVAVIALSTLSACGGSATSGDGSDPAPARPAPVHTASVEHVDAASRIRAAGILAPRDEYRLAFKVGGVIDRVAVDVGDAVKRGDVLAVLKREEVEAAVRQAGEAVEKSRRDLERAKELQADEVATIEQVQDLTTAYNVARSDLETARFNARYARIEAPADGVVQQRLAEPDELVQGGQPVLVLGSTSGGWVVRAALADRDLVRVREGDLADVTFDAFPGRPFEGRVTRVASAADPETGTFEVEIEVSQDGARFVRGLVAKVGLRVDGEGSGLRTVVPVTALVEANGYDATVYVLDAATDTARRTRVAVGPIVGDRVVIDGGLSAGDRVITDGAAWLRDGQPVAVVGEPG